MWLWHILHPEAVTNGLVNNTRSMFWSTGVCIRINRPTWPKCTIGSHSVTPPVCSPTWYYRDGQKAVRYCITPEGILWQLDLD